MDADGAADDAAAAMAAAHESLAACASGVGATDSKLVGRVSRHVVPPSVSFTNLARLHDAAKALRSDAVGKVQDYVGTSGKNLVYSARFDHAASAAHAPPPFSPSPLSPTGAASASRKRRREDDELEALEVAVNDARKKVKSAKDIPATDVDAAEALIGRALQTLRGPAGERVVQSYGLLPKKLDADDASERLVVALRCTPGVALSISSLRSAMGGFWQDGMVSVESDEPSLKLPSTEEGRIAEANGNASLLVVTSAPRAHRNGK